MNKIIIDGKEYELSAELVEKIKAEVAAQEKAENPFERNVGECYYFVDASGEIGDFIDTEDATDPADNALYSAGNYCRDKGLMEQRALHETLNRLLWRYSETHGDQMFAKQHSISRAWDDDEFYALFCVSGKQQGTVYFSSHDVAVDAIKEVVKPFMTEHPEFVW